MPLVFEWAQILFSMWVKEPLAEPCLTRMIFHQGGQNVFLKPYYWTQEYLLEDVFIGNVQGSLRLMQLIHPPIFCHRLFCIQSGWECWSLSQQWPVAGESQGHIERQQTRKLQTQRAQSGNWTCNFLPPFGAVILTYGQTVAAAAHEMIEQSLQLSHGRSLADPSWRAPVCSVCTLPKPQWPQSSGQNEAGAAARLPDWDQTGSSCTIKNNGEKKKIRSDAANFECKQQNVGVITFFSVGRIWAQGFF